MEMSFLSGFRPLGRLALSVLLLLLAMPALLATPAVAEPVDWSGTWDTRWPQGGVRLTITQDGDRLLGTYPALDGRIEGRVEGREARGTWMEPGKLGHFAWTMGADGRSFMGRSDDNEWWTGTRVDAAAIGASAAISQSSPRASLRVFLVLGEAVEDERFEYVDDMLKLLKFTDTGLNRFGQVREAKMFWLIVDQFLVRLTDLPEHLEEDSYSFILHRHDGESYELHFVRSDGLWFLVVPPLEDLRTTLHDLVGSAVLSRSRVFRMENARDTMEAFLDSMRIGRAGLDAAVDTLDLSELSPVARERESVLLAQYLNEVLARIGEVVLQEIPNDPRRPIPYVHFVHAAGDIVIAPVDTEKGVQWKFTPETLRTIRQLFAVAEDLPPPQSILPYASESTAFYFQIRKGLRDIAPAALRQFGPLEIWQWLALAVVFVLGIGCALLVSALSYLGNVIVKRPYANPAANISTPLLWGLRLLVFGLISYVSLLALGLPDRFASIVTTFSVIAMIIGAIPVEFWLVGAVRRGFDHSGAISQRGNILASLLVGIAKVAIVVGNFLLLAEALNIPYGAALAGLGIGGLAVALAARTTLENVISGFILFADRPLEVGDFCRFGQKLGTVERIGIRSTQMRTLDRTVISVPNAEFVNMHLENFGKRDKMFLRTTISLRYETSPDQLRHVLAELRRLLIAHPMVAEDPLRVRFIGFGAHSLDIEIYAYVTTTEWSDYLSIREDVYLRMIEVVHGSGTDFAFPSQTMYLRRDHGLDADKAKAAEQQVQEWREQIRLPFPDFTAEEVESIASSLPYPPEGAPRNAAQMPERSPARLRARPGFWPFGGHAKAK